ncbi:MAG: HD-GYP domain-containing protein [Burkholderiaceae bacterium]|nr:HD-GYP domain-containing protein [Burkholderiaceae bacterium]
MFAQPPSPSHVRLTVDKLDYGMFVAELDRPWLDTPFLLEGLLVQNEPELEALRQYCQFVYVDLERSTGAAAEAIRDALAQRAAKPRTSPAPIACRPRALDEAAGSDSDAPSALGRLFGWLRGRGGRDGATGGRDEDHRKAVSAAELQLPPGMALQPYSEPGPIEAELPRATQSWSRGAETLRALMADLRDDTRSDLRDIDKVAEGLVESMVETPDAMLWVARLRDQDRSTYHHCLKVGIYLIALGRHMGFPRHELVRLGQIGMLADVGKIRLPRALLEKPGMLTPAEHAVVRRHVQFGIEALRKSMTLDRIVEQGIMQHHERIDGSGYPQRLKGKDISIFGRMAAIADCFAALISDRPYAKAVSPQEALMQMYQWCGTSFHEPLLEQFVQAIGVFPVGSLVELSNGEAAIVLAHNRVRRLEPRVLVLAGADGALLEKPFERDLLNGPADDAGRPIRIARGLPAGARGLRPREYYADESASPEDGVLAPA